MVYVNEAVFNHSKIYELFYKRKNLVIREMIINLPANIPSKNFEKTVGE